MMKALTRQKYNLRKLNPSSFYHARIHENVEDERNKGPLCGVRVCDMTRILAGPYCTMVLGDMGAEVIKIERPGVGDDTRHWGPPFMGTESCYFLSINRNKKSVCIDITKESGKKIIYEIVKKSDVFVENFVPGKLSSMGFGYEKLNQINPSLIYCTLSGYGSRGPDSMKPGYDLVASAIGGMLHVTGPKDGNSCRSGVAVTDILTGLYINSAISTALYQTKVTGKGAKIDGSLLQSQIAMLTDVATGTLNSNAESIRYGTAHPSIVPYQAFKTSDRDIVIAASNNKQFINLCKALDLEELISDHKFSSNPERVKHRDILIQKLHCRLIEHTSCHWLAVLEANNVPCAHINNLKEALETPQVKNAGMIQQIDHHPTVDQIRIAGPAVEYDGDSILRETLPPPLLGQHTLEIMKTLLKYDEEKINQLLEHKVIVQNEIS